MPSTLICRVITASALIAIMSVTANVQSPPATVALQVQGRSNATPWVAALGSTVAVAWGATADGAADVFLAVSHDGGSTFGAPQRVNTVTGEARLGGEMPPRVALRHRDRLPPEIVVLWTARGEHTAIKVSRSLDDGRSFAAPVTLQTSDAPGDRGWPALTVDEAGTAHALWLDHRGMATQHRDGMHDHKAGDATDGVAMAQRSALYYAASGGTVAAEQAITQGVCYCCKTALVAGPNGELFAAWRQVYAGNIRDIAFTVSRDRGRTFSRPVRISEDRWELNGCPDDGPAMAIDSHRAVHVVWPTVIDGSQPQGALFYATSQDGRTFTPRERIPTLGSPKPSHPQISVDSRGQIMVGWDEVENGVRKAFARPIGLAAGKPNFGDLIRLDDGPSTYPVFAAGDRCRVAVWTAGPMGASVIRVRRLDK